MSPADRDSAIWYYRLGEQTLGPVPWTEIEAVIRDTLDAGELLVARGGDAGWKAAQDVLAEHPELAAPAEAPLAQPPAEEVQSAGWEIEQPPVAAGAPPEVPRITVRPPAAMPEPGMPIMHGLGAWLSQAWEVVTGSLGAFVGAVALAALVSIVSIGIAAPPLGAGLVLMCIRRFRGEEVKATDVFEGFNFFLPAWGLTLLTIALSIGLSLPVGIPVGILKAASDDPQMIAVLDQLVNVISQIIGLVIGGALFYAMVLIVDRGLGSIEAARTSWNTTKSNLLSYIGMAFVLQFVAGLGVLACIVGIFVSAPLYPAAVVAAYRYHFRGAMGAVGGIGV